MKEILLVNLGVCVLVDDQDIDIALSTTWSFDRDGYLHRPPKHRKLHLQVADRCGLRGPTIDHIDRNKLNNQRLNLRVATRAQQQHNRGLPANNSSGYLGVTFCERDELFVAQAMIGGKQKHLGSFKTAIEAAKCRDRYVKRERGVYAVLNFPDSQ